MMKKRIIIHIGTHKTGTTTIQNLLYRKKNENLEKGICYPETSTASRTNTTKHKGLFIAFQKGGAAFDRYWERVFAEFRESGAHTLILSAEGLGVSLLRRPSMVEKMSGLSKHFDLESICFLRRPDTFIESIWNQQCKIGQTQAHIDRFQNLPGLRAHRRYIDILEQWSRISKVHAIGFETALSIGIVQALSDIVGIPLSAEEQKLNVSPSMTCAATLAALSRSTGKLYNWRKIERQLGDNTRRAALGRVLRQRILDDFVHQRDALERGYGVVFPDTMPVEPDEMLPRPTAEEVAHLAHPRFLSGKQPL